MNVEVLDGSTEKRKFVYGFMNLYWIFDWISVILDKGFIHLERTQSFLKN